jgi:hypothetical protein
LGFDRSDEDNCDGEKPCIMLADLVRPPDETLLSDPRSLLPLLTVLANVTFEKHESDEFCRLDSDGDVSVSTSGNGDEGRGVISAMASGTVCKLGAIVSDRGSRSVFSLMLIIIFSSPSEVMCFSLPLLRLSAESSASNGTRFAFCGKRAGLAARLLSVSSDAAESTLEDNEGTSFGLGRRGRTSMAGVVARCGCASQQNVSRFHNLQLRFSNLFPSSIDSAHLEKTGKLGVRKAEFPHTGKSTYPSTFQKGSPHSSGRPCAFSLRPQ